MELIKDQRSSITKLSDADTKLDQENEIMKTKLTCRIDFEIEKSKAQHASEYFFFTGSFELKHIKSFYIYYHNLSYV